MGDDARPGNADHARLHPKLGGRPKRGANEEATQPRSGRPNPTDPGDAADLSIPQGYLCFEGTELRTRGLSSRKTPHPDCLHVLS